MRNRKKRGGFVQTSVKPARVGGTGLALLWRNYKERYPGLFIKNRNALMCGLLGKEAGRTILSSRLRFFYRFHGGKSFLAGLMGRSGKIPFEPGGKHPDNKDSQCRYPSGKGPVAAHMQHAITHHSAGK